MTCHFARQRKLPFSLSSSTATSSFALIHVDIWGPYHTPLILGYKFFLTIVDDHTRMTWVYMMKSKSETRELIKGFCLYVSRQFDKRVKCICSDNGLEFAMTDFYHTQGIIHETTCIETRQQNGRVERKH